jgi:hypothetical protein
MAILTKPAFESRIIFGDQSEPMQDIYESSASQKYVLGTKLEMPDGRVFRYAKAGGTALVQARMTQSGVTSAAHYTAIPQTGYARAVGQTDITALVATGAIAGTATGYEENAFSGGWLVCNKVSPAVLGDIYGILASKMVDETHIDLKLASPWRNAMLATGEITLTVNKFFKTLVFAAYDATAQAAGVPLCAVPIGYYYWSQVKGPAPLLVDGSETMDIGQAVGCPVTLGTAGNGGPLITTTAEVLRRPWGTCMEIATDGEPALVDLFLE